MNDLPSMPHRPSDGHKGTFGTVCVIGGQIGPPRVMLGGPALSALAALRCGSGLAVLALPEPMMLSALTIAPSATGLALPVDRRGALVPSAAARLLDEHGQGFDCLAIGPGMGADPPQQQTLIRLIARDDVPLVLDADALNALAAATDFQGDLRAQSVLTPHPGEYRRLAKALGIEADPVDPDTRPEAAQLLAQRLGCVVVLKGAGTVVSDGIETFVNPTGNVALATAGSGDVLTGVIASFVGQFFRPSLGVGSRQITAEQQGGLSLLDCARLGVYVHGLAADRWASKRGNAGMVAADLLEELPMTLRELR
jgi:NAD(P)H-hydrate epimerase